MIGAIIVFSILALMLAGAMMYFATHMIKAILDGWWEMAIFSGIMFLFFVGFILWALGI